MITFHFHNPTRIVFGSGKLNDLCSYPLPGKNAMLLISNGKSTKVNGSLDTPCSTRSWKAPLKK